MRECPKARFPKNSFLVFSSPVFFRGFFCARKFFVKKLFFEEYNSIFVKTLQHICISVLTLF